MTQWLAPTSVPDPRLGEIRRARTIRRLPPYPTHPPSTQVHIPPFQASPGVSRWRVARLQDIVFMVTDVREEDNGVFHLWGVTASGDSVLARIPDFEPYFYVTAPEETGNPEQQEDMTALIDVLNRSVSARMLRTAFIRSSFPTEQHNEPPEISYDVQRIVSCMRTLALHAPRGCPARNELSG